MDLHNALELFKLLKTNGHIHFIITYKLSQDHLETFFSAIRGKGGYKLQQQPYLSLVSSST